MLFFFTCFFPPPATFSPPVVEVLPKLVPTASSRSFYMDAFFRARSQGSLPVVSGAEPGQQAPFSRNDLFSFDRIVISFFSRLLAEVIRVRVSKTPR